METLDHPSVDLSSLGFIKNGKQRSMGAHVTCPTCGAKRWLVLSQVKRAIAKDSFTGLCRRCTAVANGREPPLADFNHPAVDLSDVHRRRLWGSMLWCANVVCPHCGKQRWWGLSTIKRQMARSNFTGQCLPCSKERTRAGFYQWQKRKNGGRRSVSSSGYIQLGPTYIEAADLPLFRQMENRSKYVFEHRFVLAKHLGRPLRRSECVDHMDGDKTNNKLSNLRIYVVGKQQPGSGPGHGTYYHEWQMAEARVRDLEKLLADRR